jgi:hypothetical protein
LTTVIADYERIPAMPKIFRKLSDGTIVLAKPPDMRAPLVGFSLCLVIGLLGDLLELGANTGEAQFVFIIFVPAIFITGLLRGRSVTVAVLGGALGETLMLINPSSIPLHAFTDVNRVFVFLLLDLANIVIFGALPAAAGALYFNVRYRPFTIGTLFGVQLVTAIAIGLGRTQSVNLVEVFALLVAVLTFGLLFHIGQIRIGRMVAPCMLAVTMSAFFFVVVSAVLHPPH